MQRAVKEFFWSFTQSWLTKMSGALSVPLTFVGILAPPGTEKTTLIVTAVICILTAFFSVWHSEWRRRMNVEAELKKIKDSLPEIELLFDPTDTRYLLDKPTLYNDITTRKWFVGLRNASEFKSLDEISVKVHASLFVYSSIALAHRIPNASKDSEPIIFKTSTLPPLAIEFIELFGIKSNVASTTDLLGKVLREKQTFLVEARARDAKTVIAKFEYEPTTPPTIRRVHD